MAKITKTTVDKIEPIDGKDVYLWDSVLSGFGLKVTPKGRKVFLIQYRIAGRTRRVTIGALGVVTPEQARNAAKKMLGAVAAGNDPAQAKDEQRAAVSVSSLLDVFFDEHVKTKLKPNTIDAYQRTIKLHIKPKFKTQKIKDVKRSDISRLHHKMRNTPYQANKVLAVLSKFFNWAEKNGFRDDGSNPCHHVEKFREARRERFLSQVELANLGKALNDAELNNLASPWIVAAIRLLSLTGARLNEILTLKWEYVDFENGCIRLPDSKTGAKTIYANAPTLEVLSNIPKLDGNPFVICGEKQGAHLVNLQKPWRRIRKAAQLEDVRLHDLRHSFASIAVAGGMSLPMIGALLGHSQPATTARYAHLSADPLKVASDSVGNKIAQAMPLANHVKLK